MKSKQNAVISVFLIMGMMLSGCGKKEQESAEARTIEVQTIAQTEAADAITVSGNVIPTETVKLSFKLAGVIAEVAPKEGEMVEKGQMIAKLDTSDYAIANKAAESQTSAAKAQLSAAQAEYDAAAVQVSSVLPSKQAQAKAQLDLTQATYDRVKTLYEAEAASASQMDEITAKLEADKQTYQQAIDAASAAKAQLAAAAKKVDAYAAQVNTAQAQTEKSTNDLSDTTIKSPMNGVILTQIMNAGEVTSAGYPIVAIGNIDDVYIEIGVTDTRIQEVKKGMKATVGIYGQPEKFTGTIEEIGSLADSKTRTFPVKIRVSNPEKKLRPGMIAEVNLSLGQGEAVLIPLDCVVQKASGSIVFVYQEESGKAISFPVETGKIYGNQIQVLDGLQAGDKVVTKGQFLLHDGDLVAVNGTESEELS